MLPDMAIIPTGIRVISGKKFICHLNLYTLHLPFAPVLLLFEDGILLAAFGGVGHAGVRAGFLLQGDNVGLTFTLYSRPVKP